MSGAFLPQAAGLAWRVAKGRSKAAKTATLLGLNGKKRVDGLGYSGYMPAHSWESLHTASSIAPHLLD